MESHLLIAYTVRRTPHPVVPCGTADKGADGSTTVGGLHRVVDDLGVRWLKGWGGMVGW